MAKPSESEGVDFELTMTVNGKESTNVSWKQSGVDLQTIALWEATIVGAIASLCRTQARGEDPFSALD